MFIQKEKTMKSPCKNICVLDYDNEFCLGCYRTVEEISNWQTLPYIEKERIIKECKTREENYNGKCKI